MVDACHRVTQLLMVFFVSAILVHEVSTAGVPRTIYQSPAPGASLVLPSSNIILRLLGAVDAPSVSAAGMFAVRGSRSGAHSGTTKIADDGVTILFKPDLPFAPGETVSVRVGLGIRTAAGEALRPQSFDFTIAGDLAHRSKTDPFDGEFEGREISPVAPVTARPGSVEGDTLPFDFPYIKATVFDSTSPGRIFLSNLAFGGPFVPYLLIVDNSGAPIFYRKMDGACADFKVQPNGLLTYYDSKDSAFFAMDSSYTIVDSFKTGNGYATDVHDLRILPNGHALLMAYDPERVDMSAIVPGGNSAAIVTGLIVQEIDAQKDVVFQWRSWDHFQITDATHENLTAAAIDYVHGNALEFDTDGNILLSSRHMDEITKIDRSTGAIIWRFGGKHNEFTIIGDTVQFSHQHAIRRLAGDGIIMFDNGNFHSTPFSRAVEYHLDEQAKTATLVWQYRNSPDTYGFAMGDAQRLDNGSTFIGWGATNPTATEVREDGSKVFELTLAPGMFSYRAYRFPWKQDSTQSGTGIPTGFLLSQNYPNPFNNSTKILISLPFDTPVNFNIYDDLGRLISSQANGETKSAGNYIFVFDGSNLSSGTYFYRLVTRYSDETRKMELIR